MPSLPPFLQFIGGRGENSGRVHCFLVGEKEVKGRFRARTLCTGTVAIGLVCIRFGRSSLWQYLPIQGVLNCKA